MLLPIEHLFMYMKYFQTVDCMDNGIIRTTPENSEWSIVCSFLNALRQIGELFCLQGAASESKRHLMEGLQIARILRLSKR